MTIEEFDELEYCEYIFRTEAYWEIIAEQTRRGMILASFTAWQIKETKKDFYGYLEMLGLGEKKTSLSKAMKQTLIDKNIAVAEKIRKSSLKQRRAL